MTPDIYEALKAYGWHRQVPPRSCWMQAGATNMLAAMCPRRPGSPRSAGDGRRMTPTLIPASASATTRLVIGGEITHYPTIDLALAALRAAEAASVRVDEIARKAR